MKAVDILDIGFVAILLYLVIVQVRRARARRLAVGLAVISAAYLVVGQLGLRLTERIFQGFFAVFLIILVVIFQPELRRLFERVAAWSLGKGQVGDAVGGEAEILVDISETLASRKCGALIVIRGRDPVHPYLKGGQELNGRLSTPLLLSLFEPTTEGHDGAVVLRGNQVERFAAHLPLSHNFEQIGGRGTRHAAALGLSEQCDALSIVVSEERGRVSITRDGALREVGSSSELLAELQDFLGGLAPKANSQTSPLRILRKNWAEKALAAGLAVVAWFALAYGSGITERAYPVPVMVENVPPGYELESFEPHEVEIVFRGRHEDFDLLNERGLQVRIDAFLVRLGRRAFQVSEQNLQHPDELTVVEIRPNRIELTVSPSASKPAE